MRRHPVTRFVPVLLALGILAVTVSAHAAPEPDRDPPRQGRKLIMLDDNFTPEQVEDTLKEQGVAAHVRDQVNSTTSTAMHHPTRRQPTPLARKRPSPSPSTASSDKMRG